MRLLYNAAVEAMEIKRRWEASGCWPPPDHSIEYARELLLASVYGYGHPISVTGGLMECAAPDYWNYDRSHWLYRHPLTTPERVEGSMFILSDPAADNYYHWTLDVVTKWRGVVPMPDHIYTHTKSAFQRWWIDRLGVPQDRIIEAGKYRHVRADTLLISPHRPPALCGDSLEFLRSFAPTKTDNTFNRIYVARAPCRRRKVRMERRLQHKMQESGYRTVWPAAMAVDQQMVAFQSARHVVGTHGAGLANIVWCRPGTKVTEIQHRSFQPTCYKRLCWMLRLDYERILVGRGSQDSMNMWRNLWVPFSRVSGSLLPS